MKERGFTLVETMTAIAVMGLIVLIALPKFNSAVMRTSVASARSSVANMFVRARTVAMQTNQPARVVFAGDTVKVESVPFGGAAKRVGEPLIPHEAYGVDLTTTATTVQFDPRGFTSLGAEPVKVFVSRGGYSDSIVVSGVGKVMGR